ncbi:MAG: hypothetical protein A2Y67_03790 [Candidatus Buchananbacteria bacterium RBG_13_39_9]|uniref:YdbS-like PH domain-containing protein n=1 Tax=Candidatus Buchananbacteria bacterium RBG_13_39_9 TaxID=1797531 RepID=A0A1G1XU44_9BACT|nr:MAG: hypothetical protein A2Y67_03790 [Candidatus Buchananbacteria bacterium RBG_13_39_9]
MYIERHIPNRQKGEKLILFLRRHIIALIGRWLFFACLALVPVGFYYFLLLNFPQILKSAVIYPAMILISSIYSLCMLLFFLNAFIDYYLDVWIVTDKRIIDIEQRGLFNREIAEHNLDKIQDVSGFQKGLLQTFLNYGDVNVQTAGEVQRFSFHQINKPFEVIRIINNLIEIKESALEHKILEKLQKQPE